MTETTRTPPAHHRTALPRRLALAVLLAALPLAGHAASCDPPSQLGAMRAEHVTLLNSLRGRQGLDTLQADRGLDEVAQDYACLLVASGTFDHVGPDGSDLPDRLRRGGLSYCVATENLAKGQASVREAMAAWVESPGHFRNLVNGDVQRAGLGVVALNAAGGGLAGAPGGKPPVKPADQGPGRYVWVQVFTAPCAP